jgi:hypothetical protein
MWIWKNICETYILSRSSPLILNLIFFLKIELPSAEGLLLKTMLNMWRDFNLYIGMKFKMILIEDNWCMYTVYVHPLKRFRHLNMNCEMHDFVIS